MADREVLKILDSSVKEFNRFVIENNQDNEYFDLSHYNFRGNDFREISFSKINFTGSTFRDCRIDGGFINACLIEDVKFYDCSLIDIYWHLNEIRSVLFHDCDLSKSNFECINFSDVLFRKTNLNRVNFSDIYSVKRLTVEDCDLRDSMIDLELIGNKNIKIVGSYSTKKKQINFRTIGKSPDKRKPNRPYFD